MFPTFCWIYFPKHSCQISWMRGLQLGACSAIHSYQICLIVTKFITIAHISSTLYHSLCTGLKLECFCTQIWLQDYQFLLNVSEFMYLLSLDKFCITGKHQNPEIRIVVFCWFACPTIVKFLRFPLVATLLCIFSAALSLIYMIMYHHSLLHLVVQRLSAFPSSDTFIWFFLLTLLSSIIIELLILVFNKLLFFMVSFFIKLSTINCFYLCTINIAKQCPF